MVKKPHDTKVLGIYGARLDACDAKLRFSAKCLVEACRVVRDLEHGEFIYFSDEDRLNMNFYCESFLIFLRASLDLGIGAYAAYFTGKTDLKSANEFLKKVGKAKDDNSKLEWVPPWSLLFWFMIHDEYASDPSSWLHALIGHEKGMSLRDLVVHHKNVFIDTEIDDRDRGYFVIGLAQKSMVPLAPWLRHVWDMAQVFLSTIHDDVVAAERSLLKSQISL